MTFGENLINLRKQNKMTQEQVAEKLEITRQTVSNWELNQTKPDLDQLIELSQLYKISLDKLANNNLSNLEPNQTKKINKLLTKSKNMMTIFNNKKLCIMIFTLICIVAMGTCAIVDYKINDTITWAYIPIISIIFSYFITIPLFARKNKLLLSFCSISLFVIPFLYFLEKAIQTEYWFYSLALPISFYSLIGIWISYFICRYLKINSWYKTAIITFLFGTIISPIINHTADGLPYLSFQNFVNLFSSFVISMIFIIYGYFKSIKKK